MKLHPFLDYNYGVDGDEMLSKMLAGGADPNEREGLLSETALHVATRRRRRSAVAILLDHGAEIDARTMGEKTSYAHAARRGFEEVAQLLRDRGADTSLNDADRIAVALTVGHLEEARLILKSNLTIARTGNPEEDRLLADVAGHNDPRPVELLICAGADLTAPGLDAGTPLHQAAWFGQPGNASLLIDAGAPLDVFDTIHGSSPIGWAAHGSRNSGGAEESQKAYVALVQMLLEAGSSLHYPNEPQSDDYFQILLKDATPRVREILQGSSFK